MKIFVFKKVPCILAVTFLQYLFLAAATFLLLEALVIMHKLVDAVILPLLESPLFILAVGILLPGVYTGITLPLLYSYLLPSSEKTCWLNLASPASASMLVPFPLILLITLYVLITSIVCSDDSGRRPISAEVYTRAKTLRRTRYILVLLILLLAATFTTGVLAAHLALAWLDLAFLICSFLLAAAALGLRCGLDSQVISFKKDCNIVLPPKPLNPHNKSYLK